ncbi:MAG: hypothetical protein J0H67_19355 [Rhodospirillales bacterium]|nr:hypothetical protein [Rhodospirillales bacterium]
MSLSLVYATLAAVVIAIGVAGYTFYTAQARHAASFGGDGDTLALRSARG